MSGSLGAMHRVVNNEHEKTDDDHIALHVTVNCILSIMGRLWKVFCKQEKRSDR